MHLTIFVYFVCHAVLPFLLLTFILLFFVDVLQFGIWREANSLADPSLRKIVPDLVNLQLESRAPATVQKFNTDLVG